MVFMIKSSAMKPVATTELTIAAMPIPPAMAAENPRIDIADAAVSSIVPVNRTGIFIPTIFLPSMAITAPIIADRITPRIGP